MAESPLPEDPSRELTEDELRKVCQLRLSRRAPRPAPSTVGSDDVTDSPAARVVSRVSPALPAHAGACRSCQG